MYIPLILSLFCYCSNYVKLPKYGTIKVKANTEVYLDISSFDTGTAIDFEFEMNYFFSNDLDSYTFKIGQVDALSYAIYSYWESIPLVVNYNISCKSKARDDCIFSWSEIKKEVKYIFFDALEPYYHFDCFDKKILIKHIGGLSTIKTITIAITVVVFIIVVVTVVIIYYLLY